MTSQRVERTWIRTGGYGRFRGEWVKLCGSCGCQSSHPKVVSPEVMAPETRVMLPESFSLVTKNSELCVVPGDITGEMTFA